MSKRLSENLRRRAISWAGQMTRLAKAYAPNHIRDAISSHVESKADGTYLIRTVANRKTAPDARAWEYGSGLRARRGAKQKYPIFPKKGKYLAFHWEVATQNPERFTFLDDGRVILPKVMHPGIQAANEGRGYIAPAQVELRKKARRELDLDIRNGGDLSDLYGDQYHPTDAGHGVVAAGLAPYYVTGGTIPSPLAARVYAESEALE